MTTTLLLLLAPLSHAQPQQAPAPVDEVAPPPVEAVSEAAIARWVAELADKDYDKLRAAHAGLMRAGPKAKAAVPALIKLLNNKNANRTTVVEILGAIGPD